MVDVARQAGHSPTMPFDTYGHVFDELAEQPRISAETLIRRARGGEDVPVSYPREPDERAEPRAQCRTRTGDPFLTMEVLYQLS